MRYSVNNIFKYQLSKDLLYVFLSQIIIMLSALIINKVISVYYGVDGFALYSLINKTAYFFNCIMTGGMVIALPRYLSRYDKSTSHLKKYFLPSSLLIFATYTTVLGVSVLLFPNIFSTVFFKEKSNYSIIGATIIMAIAQGLGLISYSYFQGNGDFKKYNSTQMLFNLLLLVSTIIIRSNLLAMLYISHLVVLLYSILVLKKETSITTMRNLDKRGIIASVKSLSFFGFPRMLNRLVFHLQSIFPVLIILHRLSIIDVGIYTAGLAIQNIVTPIFSITGGVLLQRVSKYYKSHKFDLINKVLFITLIVYLAISSIGAFVLILFKVFFIKLMFSEKFMVLTGILWYFALSIIPRSIYQLFCNPLDAVSRTPYNLITTSVSTIIFLILLFSASTLVDCARAYLLSNALMGSLSLIFWWIVVKKER